MWMAWESNIFIIRSVHRYPQTCTSPFLMKRSNKGVLATSSTSQCEHQPRAIHFSDCDKYRFRFPLSYLIARAGVVAVCSLSVTRVVDVDLGGPPALDAELRSHQSGALGNAVVVAELHEPEKKSQPALQARRWQRNLSQEERA